MTEAKEEPVNIRNEKRLRLRPWLLSRLKSGAIPGLEWKDKKEGIFKIPWNHGGKNDWTPEKGHIFKDWAVHTGKFVDGVDEPNHAKWKTNLRCALHKAKDIEEQKSAGRANDDKNPFRVYKFMRLKKKGGIPIPDDPEISEDTNPCSGPPVPTFIATYTSGASSGSSHPFSSGNSQQMSTGSQPRSNVSSDSGNVSQSRQLHFNAVSPYSNESSNPSQVLSPSSSETDDNNASELDYDLLKDDILQNLECGRLPSDLTDLSFEDLQLSGSLFDKTSLNGQQPNTSATTSRNPLPPLTNSNLHDIPQKAMPADACAPDVNNQYNIENNTQPFMLNNSSWTVQNMNRQDMIPAFSQKHQTSQSTVTTADPVSTLFATTGNLMQNTPTTTFADLHACPVNTSAFSGDNAVSNQAVIYSTVSNQALIGNTASNQALFGDAVSNQVLINNTFANQALIQPSAFSPPAPAANQEIAIQQSPGSQMSPGGQSDSSNVDMTSIPETPSTSKPGYSKYSSTGYQYHRCTARYGHEMFIELVYKNNVVKKLHVVESKGCRLVYKPGEKDVVPDEFKDFLYGSEAKERQVLEMPSWPSDMGNETTIKKASGVLLNAMRGIVLECKNGNISVTRYCKTKVYSSSKICPEVNRSDPATSLLLFDYEQDFLTSYECYKTSRKNPPSPNVCLFFGQQNVSENQPDKVLVMVRVTSCTAVDLLHRDAEEYEKSCSIHISQPNQVDEIAEQLYQQVTISDQ